MPADSMETDGVQFRYRKDDEDSEPFDNLLILGPKWKYDLSMENFLRRLPNVR